jgi:hypothetical protein
MKAYEILPAGMTGSAKTPKPYEILPGQGIATQGLGGKSGGCGGGCGCSGKCGGSSGEPLIGTGWLATDSIPGVVLAESAYLRGASSGVTGQAPIFAAKAPFDPRSGDGCASLRDRMDAARRRLSKAWATLIGLESLRESCRAGAPVQNCNLIERLVWLPCLGDGSRPYCSDYAAITDAIRACNEMRPVSPTFCAVLDASIESAQSEVDEAAAMASTIQGQLTTCEFIVGGGREAPNLFGGLGLCNIPCYFTYQQDLANCRGNCSRLIQLSDGRSYRSPPEPGCLARCTDAANRNRNQCVETCRNGWGILG